jgi:hypothetical protein
MVLLFFWRVGVPMTVPMMVVVFASFATAIAMAVSMVTSSMAVRVRVGEGKHAHKVDQQAANRDCHQAVCVHVWWVEESLSQAMSMMVSNLKRNKANL